MFLEPARASISRCGVSIDTGYETPVFGFSQKVGAAWVLPASVVTMAVAASFSLRPTRLASDRATFTFKVGCWNDYWIRASAITGTSLILARRPSANVRSAARSLPTTCTSIGAGVQKLRIWLTISAGRNTNEVPGNILGSSSRMVFT
jgi:hypothetical protein